MNKWSLYSTKDLIAQNKLVINDGYRAKNIELSKTGLPFLRAGNLNENGFNFDKADFFPISDLHKVGIKKSKPGDVILTTKGTVGRFAFVRDDTEPVVYAPQISFWRVLDKNTIEPRFLYYWILGKEFEIQCNQVKGNTDMADYVSLADQRQMQITLPHSPPNAASPRFWAGWMTRSRPTGASIAPWRRWLRRCSSITLSILARIRTARLSRVSWG